MPERLASPCLAGNQEGLARLVGSLPHRVGSQQSSQVGIPHPPFRSAKMAPKTLKMAPKCSTVLLKIITKYIGEIIEILVNWRICSIGKLGENLVN